MGSDENKGEKNLLVGVCGRCADVGGKRRANGEYDEKAGRVFPGEEATCKCRKDENNEIQK